MPKLDLQENSFIKLCELDLQEKIYHSCSQTLLRKTGKQCANKIVPVGAVSLGTPLFAAFNQLSIINVHELQITQRKGPFRTLCVLFKDLMNSTTVPCHLRLPAMIQFFPEKILIFEL